MINKHGSKELNVDPEFPIRKFGISGRPEDNPTRLAGRPKIRINLNKGIQRALPLNPQATFKLIVRSWDRQLKKVQPKLISPFSINQPLLLYTKSPCFFQPHIPLSFDSSARNSYSNDMLVYIRRPLFQILTHPMSHCIVTALAPNHHNMMNATQGNLEQLTSWGKGRMLTFTIGLWLAAVINVTNIQPCILFCLAAEVHQILLESWMKSIFHSAVLCSPPLVWPIFWRQNWRMGRRGRGSSNIGKVGNSQQFSAIKGNKRHHQKIKTSLCQGMLEDQRKTSLTENIVILALTMIQHFGFVRISLRALTLWNNVKQICKFNHKFF